MFKLLECNLTADWRGRLQAIAYSLWGSVAFVAVIFSMRGLAGAFRQEFSTLGVCMSAIIAASVCLAAMVCFRASVSGRLSRNQTLSVFALTVLPPTLLGVVLCPPSSSLGIAWITLMAVALTISQHLVANPVESSQDVVDEASPSENLPVASAILPPALEEPDLTQWMTRRSVLEEGERWERIEGQSTLEFAAGQRHATMHISICPPLSVAPEIECEIQGEVLVEWKVAAVHPYGVRLELRRPAPAVAALSVAVGYTMAAVVQPSTAKAA